MSIYTFIRDLFNIIKNQWKMILGIGVLVTIAYTLLRIFYFSGPTEYMSEEEILLENEYSFDIYIEEELGVFQNSYLLEIILTAQDIVEEIEADSGVEVSSVLASYEEESDAIYTEEDPINIERNRSSNLMMFTINVGSEEENQQVAQAYYDWLQEPDHELFENKTIYFITEPKLVNGDESVEDTNAEAAQSSLVDLMFIIQVVGAAVAGLIIGLAAAIIRVLFSRTIDYSLSYGWGPEDTFVSADGTEDEDVIFDALVRSDKDELVILAENNFSEDMISRLGKVPGKQVQVKRSMDDVPLGFNPQEIALFIEKGTTTKEWYKCQRNKIKVYNAEIKIVER